jgi:hypothetical protein
MLHAVLLAPGRCVPIGAHTFGICVATGMPHSGAKSIPLENNLYAFFFCILSKREMRLYNARLSLLRSETHII